ncbi:hypothetical protein JG688_00012304 [Phytophthora aleatoria]|uniref:Uncharacterized protein n=1 Tax=Phytophthora aleatoria TaxID=2496075 RepID=A0A8J5MES8_9STRA|nr:hypothetical protein JG688_00012304 [Phytophthora aleatoria]
MTRAAAWSSCNRALDERMHKSQWQAHRDRIEFIQSSSSVSTQAFSSALAASAHPHRIHSNRNSSNPAKLNARSKSPAAKARQNQIDRDNLALIRKIIALDNVTPRCGSKKKHPSRPQEERHPKATLCADRNTIVVPERAHSNHECLHPLPDVPQTPASHVLYTRASATMKNNFVEYNAPTMMHSSNSTSAAARVRSRAQSKILHENKKIIRQILSTRTTVDRSALERHEEKHFKLRSIMSRHRLTSKTLRNNVDLLGTDTNSSDSVVIRVDPTSHLGQQPKCRPRSASQASTKSMQTARINVSNESLVSRIRKMTLDNQCEDL